MPALRPCSSLEGSLTDFDRPFSFSVLRQARGNSLDYLDLAVSETEHKLGGCGGY